jgi:hypothetical protein
MSIEDARRWHRQLYQEITLEPRDDEATSPLSSA